MKDLFNKIKEIIIKNKEISILGLLVIIIGGGFCIKTLFFNKWYYSKASVCYISMKTRTGALIYKFSNF